MKQWRNGHFPDGLRNTGMPSPSRSLRIVLPAACAQMELPCRRYARILSAISAGALRSFPVSVEPSSRESSPHPRSSRQTEGQSSGRLRVLISDCCSVCRREPAEDFRAVPPRRTSCPSRGRLTLQVHRWRNARFLFGGPVDQDCAKWIFNSMAISYAASNRTPKPLLDGRNWRGKERRLCNFSVGDVTLPLWLTERCSSTGDPRWTNWTCHAERK